MSTGSHSHACAAQAISETLADLFDPCLAIFSGSPASHTENIVPGEQCRTLLSRASFRDVGSVHPEARVGAQVSPVTPGSDVERCGTTQLKESCEPLFSPFPEQCRRLASCRGPARGGATHAHTPSHRWGARVAQLLGLWHAVLQLGSEGRGMQRGARCVLLCLQAAMLARSPRKARPRSSTARWGETSANPMTRGILGGLGLAEIAPTRFGHFWATSGDSARRAVLSATRGGGMPMCGGNCTSTNLA